MNSLNVPPYAEKKLDRDKLIFLGCLFLILLFGSIFPRLIIVGLFLFLLVGAVVWYRRAGSEEVDSRLLGNDN